MVIAHTRSALRLSTAVVAPMLLLAACGGSGTYSGSGGSSGSSAPAKATTVETRSGALGTYLTDGSGRTLYLFVADHAGQSACSGACVSAWPPLTSNGAPAASGAAKAGMLATLSRTDGSKQVSYGGHPLYYFAGDTGPGQTSGQGVNGFGAKWWVVSPAGSAITRSGS
jgi:predicted lipoprotein with Yx(FWY)xxD motif